MATPSSLRDFNVRALLQLMREGITMRYNAAIYTENEFVGYWEPEKLTIHICPLEDKVEEDITILHEWLHAYDDLYLDEGYGRHSEKQIEWWARWHYRQDPSLVEIIRHFYAMKRRDDGGSDGAVW